MSDDLRQIITNLREYRDTLRDRAGGSETPHPSEDYLYGKASGIDAAIASLVEYHGGAAKVVIEAVGSAPEYEWYTVEEGDLPIETDHFGVQMRVRQRE